MKILYTQVDWKWHMLLNMENIKSYSLVINLLSIRKTIKLYGTVTEQSWYQLSLVAVNIVKKMDFYVCLWGIYKILWNLDFCEIIVICQQ